MDNRSIGIFDSGIGGLTVLREIIKKLPHEKNIYYADIDNVPYGNKPKEEVKEYIFKAIDFLISKDVKAIVIACNTATSIAVKEIRKKYSIPIIGTEPAVKPAIQERGNEKILVMATETTIREEKLNNLINELNSKEYIELLSMPKLVEFAEKREFYSDEVINYIKERTIKYNLENFSSIVLGCTHFPFFREALTEVFPNEVKIIDGSTGIENRLKTVLNERNEVGDNKLEVDYYYSGRYVENKNELDELLKNKSRE